MTLNYQTQQTVIETNSTQQRNNFIVMDKNHLYEWVLCKNGYSLNATLLHLPPTFNIQCFLFGGRETSVSFFSPGNKQQVQMKNVIGN